MKSGNCNYCGKAGHWARECFKKQKDKANGGAKRMKKTSQNSQNSQKTYKKQGGIKTVGSDEEDMHVSVRHAPLLSAADSLNLPRSAFDNMHNV